MAGDAKWSVVKERRGNMKVAVLKTFLSHKGVRVNSCCFSWIDMSQCCSVETNATAASVSQNKAWLPQRALTSAGGLGGVGLRVAPPPPDPALHREGAALIVEPPALLKGAEQLVQRLREVRS